MNKIRFAFVGGDLRLGAAHLYVKSMGYPSSTFLSERSEGVDQKDKSLFFPDADVYVLPLPLTSDKININSPLSDLSLSFKDFCSMLPKGATVFGGLIPEEIKNMAEENGISLYDYYTSEELQIKNAVPTAEGAIEIALREMPITLRGTKSLLTGTGRISKVSAPLLYAFGSEVTVAGRNPESNLWNEMFGYKAIDIASISESAKEYDIIFNTVPSKILTAEILSLLKKDCLIIDLASRPGGVDLDAASLLGIRVIWALGLPGKCAPVTSGRIIGSTILNMLKGGDLNGK